MRRLLLAVCFTVLMPSHFILAAEDDPNLTLKALRSCYRQFKAQKIADQMAKPADENGKPTPLVATTKEEMNTCISEYIKSKTNF